MDTTSSAVRVLNAWRNRDEQGSHQPAPVVTHTRGAALIIEAAVSCELPLPADVLVSSACVEFTFDNIDELQTWSAWLGAPITTEKLRLGPFGTMTHHVIQTDLYDVPVRWSAASVLAPAVSL